MIYYSQCVTGKKKLQDYLDFTNAYFDEDNYISLLIWLNISTHFIQLTHKEKFSDEIKQYAINFLRTIFDRLGWDSKKGEPHTNALLRSFAISGLGKLGDEEILKESKNRFDKFLKIQIVFLRIYKKLYLFLVAWKEMNLHTRNFYHYTKRQNLKKKKLRFLLQCVIFNKRICY